MRTPVRSLVAWSRATVLSATLTSALAPHSMAGEGVPDPAPSTIGAVINLGGLTGGAVDPFATKTVTIRDAFNNPVIGAAVVINFTNCSADIRLCIDQPHHTGAFFDCAQKTVTAITNASGVATFRLAGGSINPGVNPPGVGGRCATVQVYGVPLGNLTVGTPDQNGFGGIDVLDMAAFASDRFGSYRGRSDFNGDGSVTVQDFGIFAQFRFSGGSITSCALICP